MATSPISEQAPIGGTSAKVVPQSKLSAQIELNDATDALAKAKNVRQAAAARSRVSDARLALDRAIAAELSVKQEPKPESPELAYRKQRDATRQQAENGERQQRVEANNRSLLKAEEERQATLDLAEKQYGMDRKALAGLPLDVLKKEVDAKRGLAGSKERGEYRMDWWARRQAQMQTKAKEIGVDKTPEYVAADRRADAAARILSNAETHLKTISFDADAGAMAKAQEARDLALRNYEEAEADVQRVLSGGGKPGAAQDDPSDDVTDKYAALRKRAAGAR